ncbi:MAG: hypothetical protein ACYTGL_25195 [Planctomycetota bacterium]|jgi:hypothetical protein
METGTLLILFESGEATLDDAAEALRQRAFAVEERTLETGGEVLTVKYGNGPTFHVCFNDNGRVIEESREIGDDSDFAEQLRRCSVRFEVIIEDLDEAIDEMNSLIELQLSLQSLTGGFIFNCWNSELSEPE